MGEEPAPTYRGTDVAVTIGGKRKGMEKETNTGAKGKKEMIGVRAKSFRKA